MILALFAIVYGLLMIAGTAVNVYVYRADGDLYWGDWFDWLLFGVAILLGPVFILTQGAAISLIWALILLFEVTGATLYAHNWATTRASGMG